MRYYSNATRNDDDYDPADEIHCLIYDESDTYQ